jgi:hypothetical protein
MEPEGAFRGRTIRRQRCTTRRHPIKKATLGFSAGPDPRGAEPCGAEPSGAGRGGPGACGARWPGSLRGAARSPPARDLAARSPPARGGPAPCGPGRGGPARGSALRSVPPWSCPLPGVHLMHPPGAQFGGDPRPDADRYIYCTGSGAHAQSRAQFRASTGGVGRITPSSGAQDQPVRAERAWAGRDLDRTGLGRTSSVGSRVGGTSPGRTGSG